MNELPFELKPYHKALMKYSWKRIGLITDNFEEIYNKYIYATHCELCNKQFTKTIDRQMEHDHQTGKFRNIVCNSCNRRKADLKIHSNNSSGVRNIVKKKDTTCKQGFRWEFYVKINQKHTFIKSSVNLDKLVKFAEQWKKDNNYHT